MDRQTMPKILSAHILTLPMKCSEPEKPTTFKLPPQNPQSVKKPKTKYPLYTPVGLNQQQSPRTCPDQESGQPQSPPDDDQSPAKKLGGTKKKVYQRLLPHRKTTPLKEWPVGGGGGAGRPSTFGGPPAPQQQPPAIFQSSKMNRPTSSMHVSAAGHPTATPGVPEKISRADPSTVVGSSVGGDVLIGVDKNTAVVVQQLRKENRALMACVTLVVTVLVLVVLLFMIFQAIKSGAAAPPLDETAAQSTAKTIITTTSRDALGNTRSGNGAGTENEDQRS